MNVNAGCDVDIGSRASFNDGDITLNVEDAEFSSESQIGFAFQTFENDSLLYNLENEVCKYFCFAFCLVAFDSQNT